MFIDQGDTDLADSYDGSKLPLLARLMLGQEE